MINLEMHIDNEFVIRMDGAAQYGSDPIRYSFSLTSNDTSGTEFYMSLSLDEMNELVQYFTLTKSLIAKGFC